MIVIADTSPVNYLILIGEIDVLPVLYHRVLVPFSVCEELKSPRAPEAVQTWAVRLRTWLEARAPSKSPDVGLAHLDTRWHRGPVDVIVRFYQAEWLSRLPRKSGWEFFLRVGWQYRPLVLRQRRQRRPPSISTRTKLA